MKGEFLLEIGAEEIPAGFIVPARQALTEILAKAFTSARISFGDMESYATPRRLIVRVRDVAARQISVELEKIGPSTAAAFDEKGNPTKAGLGFAKSQGVEVADLIVIKTSKGEQVAVRKTEEGRATSAVMSRLLPEIIEKIPFPKTMHWMDLDVKFARPIHWITALFDGEVIPFSIGNISSGNTSRGHRFASPQEFTVTCFDDLNAGLIKRGVIPDALLRRETIEQESKKLASDAGFTVFDDQGLLDEITYLVESPYPVMGSFAAEFLELPASILITCMKKHQRYFSVRNENGLITNRFIAVNNTPVKDPAVSVKGHQRVLKARLEDARFYFKEDRKAPLFERLDALKGVVFHSKLGTAYEKVERFTALAVELAKRFAPDKVEEVKHASLLCKCDLETGIVYEFPELQGIIGSFYARMDGEPDEIATAIREHYLPSHAGDSLPEGIIGSLISIADRMDTIVGCFSVGLIPTGAADPYALRRNALGIIQILMQLDHPLDLRWFTKEALKLLSTKCKRDPKDVEADVIDFIRTRFVNFHTSRDFALDVVESAVRARFDDLVDARKRVEALAKWKNRDDFDAVMVGFKRVVNILKNALAGQVSENLLSEEAEKNLYAEYKRVKQSADPLVESGDYARALEIMAELKPSIDKFFDTVLVMVENEAVRKNRLGMLKQIGELFGRIADFSFIGSTA